MAIATFYGKGKRKIGHKVTVFGNMGKESKNFNFKDKERESRGIDYFVLQERNKNHWKKNRNGSILRWCITCHQFVIFNEENWYYRSSKGHIFRDHKYPKCPLNKLNKHFAKLK